MAILGPDPLAAEVPVVNTEKGDPTDYFMLQWSKQIATNKQTKASIDAIRTYLLTIGVTIP